MGLESRLFTQPNRDPRLDACLVNDPSHIQLGASGDHVRKIQTALARIDGAKISVTELGLGVPGTYIPPAQYGPSTAAAVRAYKANKKRNILNYKNEIDDIVGKKTIASLDREMLALEKSGPTPPAPPVLPPAFAELQVVKFDETAPFILARDSDDPNKSDLDFHSPPVPRLTLPQSLAISASEAITGIHTDVQRRDQMLSEVFKSNQLDGIRMAKVFFENDVPGRLVPFDVGTSISNRVLDSEEFEHEHRGVHKDLDDALKMQFVSGTVDYRKLRGKPATHPKLGDVLSNPEGVKEPPSIKFESFRMIALIGSFQGCTLVLKSFDVDRAKNTYRALLRYDWIDHYGVDNGDVVPDSNLHGTPGQVAFWRLQHESRPHHMPYRPLISVEKEVKGRLDPAIR